MSSIKNAKCLQDLQGENVIRGRFWVVANRNSNKEKILGYTQDGTINIDRDYRDASQNQTISNVKGLKVLDSANVSFETSSLELDETLLSDIKGLKKGSYTDIDGTKYTSFEESAYLDWNRYINTLDVIFEFTDGKIGVFRMFNVIETGSESITLSKSDDATVAVKFEATIKELDCDEKLPYMWLIEEESVEDLLDRAISALGKSPIIINTNNEALIPTQIESASQLVLKNEDSLFGLFTANANSTDITKLIDSETQTFVKDLKVVVEGNDEANTTKEAIVAITYVFVEEELLPEIEAGIPTSTADGFTIEITVESKGEEIIYSTIKSDSNDAVIDLNELVNGLQLLTVSGLAPEESISVELSATTKNGITAGDVAGTALPEAPTITAGTVTPTVDGGTFDLTVDLKGGTLTSSVVSTDNGVVSPLTLSDGINAMTVTGLTAGQTAIVTYSLIASNGNADGTTSVTAISTMKSKKDYNKKEEIKK